MITVMIHYVIYQLMCVTDPLAHMSLVHSILSLKLGVTPEGRKRVSTYMLIAERAYLNAKKAKKSTFHPFSILKPEALFSRQECQISQYTSHSAFVSVHIYKAVLLSW